jgi:hypothetical protein
LVVAWWAGRAPAVRPWIAAAGVVGALEWGWLVVEVLRRRRTLIVDFEATADPLYRAWRTVLPDGRSPSLRDVILLVGWLGGLAVAALLAARRVSSRRPPSPEPSGGS